MQLGVRCVGFGLHRVCKRLVGGCLGGWIAAVLVHGWHGRAHRRQHSGRQLTVSGGQALHQKPPGCSRQWSVGRKALVLAACTLVWHGEDGVAAWPGDRSHSYPVHGTMLPAAHHVRLVAAPEPDCLSPRLMNRGRWLPAARPLGMLRMCYGRVSLSWLAVGHLRPVVSK